MEKIEELLQSARQSTITPPEHFATRLTARFRTRYVQLSVERSRALIEDSQEGIGKKWIGRIRDNLMWWAAAGAVAGGITYISAPKIKDQYMRWISPAQIVATADPVLIVGKSFVISVELTRVAGSDEILVVSLPDALSFHSEKHPGVDQLKILKLNLSGWNQSSIPVVLVANAPGQHYVKFELKKSSGETVLTGQSQLEVKLAEGSGN